MSEFDKMSEDDYNRGDGNTNKINDDTSKYAHDLPHHDEFVGPRNTPKHVGMYEHKKALVMSDSPTGIDLVHLTVDTEEHSKRLVKRLFSKGLIAQADLQDGGFSRHYVRAGTTESELDTVDLELYT